MRTRFRLKAATLALALVAPLTLLGSAPVHAVDSVNGCTAHNPGGPYCQFIMGNTGLAVITASLQSTTGSSTCFSVSGGGLTQTPPCVGQSLIGGANGTTFTITIYSSAVGQVTAATDVSSTWVGELQEQATQIVDNTTVPTVAVPFELPDLGTGVSPGCQTVNMPAADGGSMGGEMCRSAVSDGNGGGWWAFNSAWYVANRRGGKLYQFHIYLEWKGDGKQVTEVRANHCMNDGTWNGWQYDGCSAWNSPAPSPNISVFDEWNYHYICCSPHQPHNYPHVEASFNGRGGISGTVYSG